MPCTGLLEAGFREILPRALTGGTSMRLRVVARSGNWGPVLAATAAATFVIVVSLIFADTAQEGWRRATRDTARLGLIVLLIAYTASCLNQLVAGRLMHALMRRRRSIGLSFAAIMAIHVFCIFALAAVSRDRHVIHVLDTGGLAYVFIAVMALTSSDYSMRLLGVWWRRLHFVAIHVVLIKFLQLVYQKATAGSLVSLILLMMIGSSIAVRIAAVLMSGSRSAAPALEK